MWLHIDLISGARSSKYPLRYMAGEVYRFLLRMPTHLRASRLTDATNESGRSLNAEIVSRLEESLADNPGVVRRLGLRISGASTALGERITRDRRTMTPNQNPRWRVRRRRVAIGLAAATIVLTGAVAGGAWLLNPSTPTAAPIGEARRPSSSRRSRNRSLRAAGEVRAGRDAD